MIRLWSGLVDGFFLPFFHNIRWKYSVKTCCVMAILKIFIFLDLLTELNSTLLFIEVCCFMRGREKEVWLVFGDLYVKAGIDCSILF